MEQDPQAGLYLCPFTSTLSHPHLPHSVPSYAHQVLYFSKAWKWYKGLIRALGKRDTLTPRPREVVSGDSGFQAAESCWDCQSSSFNSELEGRCTFLGPPSSCVLATVLPTSCCSLLPKTRNFKLSKMMAPFPSERRPLSHPSDFLLVAKSRPQLSPEAYGFKNSLLFTISTIDCIL